MQTKKKPESLAYRYKKLFSRTKNMILSPKQEWINIFKEKSDYNSILSNFVLPYIGIITLITFISSLTTLHVVDYTLALKSALSKFCSLFLGLLGSYYITTSIIPKFVQKPLDKNVKLLAIKIIAYSSIIIYLANIAISLMPQLYFLQIVTLYIGYLIWLGAKHLGQYENKDLRIVFTIVVTLLLLLLPYMISIVFIQI